VPPGRARCRASGLPPRPGLSICRRDCTAIEFARCFLRLADLPNFALDRLSRYEAMLWRQAGRVLFALHALDRRKPQERNRPAVIPARRLGPNIDFAKYLAGASSLADDS
jgi:hypothetical protein